MEINRIVSKEAILTDRIKKIKKASQTSLHADWERAHLLTEYWRDSDMEPIMQRRANAFNKILSEIGINIFEGELIVGSLTKHLLGTIFRPEYQVDYLKDEWDEFSSREADRVIPPEDDKEIVFNDIEFWEGKTLQDAYIPLWRKRWGGLYEDTIEAKLNIDTNVLAAGRMIADYQKLMDKGLIGVIDEAEETIEKRRLLTSEEYHQYDFRSSVIIACKAVIKFSNRYADLAQEMALQENDEKRKKELETIVGICRHVPENPPRSFHEAVQSAYLTHLCIEMENNTYGYSFGRLDQYLYPFYKKDVEEGIITKEEAAEILASFWLKLSVIRQWDKLEVTQVLQTSNFQNITIGGRNENGDDASNELSRLIVEVDTALKLRQPTLSLRYHEATDEDFLFEIAEDIRTGGGKPAIFCEDYANRVLPAIGVEKEDVSLWAPVGCVELCIPGKVTPYSGAMFSCPHCLELVFNNGIHRLSGKKIGLETGDVEKFSTFEEFLDAYRKQYDYHVGMAVEAAILNEFTVKPDLTPLPFASALMDGCIESGKSVYQGGAKYPQFTCFPIGQVTTANSLCAIDKLVYKDKVISMKKLKEALAADFEGEHARIRKLAMDLPKYGNDNDEADSYLKKAFKLHTDVATKYEGPFGQPLRVGYLGITAHYFHGLGCGATPDGRKATKPFADGSLSAFPGTDKRGPTSVIKSAVKVDAAPALATLFNLKFHPSALSNEDGVKSLWNLVDVYSQSGGYHLQFNVVDKDQLIAAQKKPEEYKDLLIRIAGFSAYFVDLAPMMQDELISRTEHSF